VWKGTIVTQRRVLEGGGVPNAGTSVVHSRDDGCSLFATSPSTFNASSRSDGFTCCVREMALFSDVSRGDCYA